MAPHAPITPTQNTPTVTDKPSARWTWTWRHAFAGTVLLADAIYIAIITSGIRWSTNDRIIHPAMSHILVCALGVTTAVSLYLILEGRRLNDEKRRDARRDEQFVIVISEIAALRAEIANSRGRDWASEEPPTVPGLTGTQIGSQRTYASVASVHHSGIDVEGVLDTLMRRVDKRFDDRLADLQKLVGVEREMAAAAGDDVRGSVRSLLPRTGR